MPRFLTTLGRQYNEKYQTPIGIYDLVEDFGGDIKLWPQVQGKGVNRLHRARDLSGDRMWQAFRATRTVNAAIAPDGTTTAALFKEDNTLSNGTNSTHRIAQIISKPPTSPTRLTFSIYAKKKERTRIRIRGGSSGFGGGFYAGVDLDGGQIVYTGTLGSNWFVTDYGIEPAAQGFYRCWVSGITDFNANNQTSAVVEMDSGSGSDPVSVAYTGDGSSGVYLWGAKYEYGDEVSPYLPSPYEDGQGRETILHVPAGTYDFTSASYFLANSYPRCTILGADRDTTILEGQPKYGAVGYPGEDGNQNGSTADPYSAPRIQSVTAGATQVTLVDPTNRLRNFYVNQPVMLACYDLQGYGLPPNNHFVEFNRILAIDSATGVITLTSPVIRNYKSTYPLGAAGSNSDGDTLGNACLLDLSHNWDMELLIRDLSIDASSDIFGSNIRDITFQNVKFLDNPAIASEMENTRFIDCTIINGGEMDKLCDLVRFDGCTVGGITTFQSTSINRLEINNSTFHQLQGTPREAEITDSSFDTLWVGPSAYGATVGDLIFDNVHVESLADRTDNRSFAVDPTTDIDLLTGIITVDSNDHGNGAIVLVPGCWCIPGGPAPTGSTRLIAPPFQILDVTRSGDIYYYQTDIPVSDPRVASWNRVSPHPGPRIKVTNCTTGHLKYINDDSGTFHSRGCYFNGTSDSSIFSAGRLISLFPDTLELFGYLEELRINVTTPYTGTQGTLTLTPFYDSQGSTKLRLFHADGTVTTTYEIVVNLKIAGERVITASGVTGAQAGDTLSAWTADSWATPISPTAPSISASINTENSSVYPEFTVTATLNHGI